MSISTRYEVVSPRGYGLTLFRTAREARRVADALTSKGKFYGVRTIYIRGE